MFDALPSGVSVVIRNPTTKSTTNHFVARELRGVIQRSPLRVFPVDVVEVAAMSLPFVRPKPPGSGA